MQSYWFSGFQAESARVLHCFAWYCMAFRTLHAVMLAALRKIAWPLGVSAPRSTTFTCQQILSYTNRPLNMHALLISSPPSGRLCEMDARSEYVIKCLIKLSARRSSTLDILRFRIKRTHRLHEMRIKINSPMWLKFWCPLNDFFMFTESMSCLYD